MEPALLYPVEHGSEESQQDLVRIKLRDNLVRARVGVINSIRSTVKSLGYHVPNSSSERFHKIINAALPPTLSQVIAPSVQALEALSLRINSPPSHLIWTWTKIMSPHGSTIPIARNPK
jgi:hypothetical protein